MLGNVMIFAAITALATAAGYLGLVHAPRRWLRPTGEHWIGWACRLVLAAVFLVAAIEKGSDPYGFASSIYAYRVLPASWATLLGILMPPIEFCACLALLSGLGWRGGAVVLGGLLLVFIVALFQAIVRGIDIDCGCFGKESSPVSFWLIARNYGLLLLALFALRGDWRRRRST